MVATVSFNPQGQPLVLPPPKLAFIDLIFWVLIAWLILKALSGKHR